MIGHRRADYQQGFLRSQARRWRVANRDVDWVAANFGFS
jgi:hypothetical protein